MPIYNSIEYSDIYSKTSRGLYQYYRDKPAVDNNKNITDFLDNDDSILFKFKQKITGQSRNGDTNNVEIMIPSKYLSTFWGTRQMPLTNCEVSLQLKWSAKFILVAGNAAHQLPTFTITYTKIYIPVVTLATQDNVKLFKQ